MKHMQWPDGKNRCSWANPANPLYLAYHDNEWGQPLHDDRRLLELLILENFQAGLSWECVLNKRAAFRRAFANFELEKICAWGPSEIPRLMRDESIIRNRLKIAAAIGNAKIFAEIASEQGSFDNYIWGWTDGKTVYENCRVKSPLSETVSLDLRKRGMKFVGSVITYSFLQAVGIICSHENDCFLHRMA